MRCLVFKKNGVEVGVEIFGSWVIFSFQAIWKLWPNCEVPKKIWAFLEFFCDSGTSFGIALEGSVH